MAVYKNISELVGNTPLSELCNFQNTLSAKIFAKLEFYNPAGSVKDRVAKSMIEDAERSGRLKTGATIIEPTSGNTGIALAAIAVSKGYKVIITMPETMSVERRTLMKSYGAEVVLTEGAKGMRGAIQKAEELAKEIPNSLIAGQFENPANPLAHEKTTGPEIWKDTNGKVDIFVAGVGTGGTISGAGRYLKAMNPAIKVIAVEPANSPVISKGVSGAHKIQGIGAGFIPENLDTSILDGVIAVTDEDAYFCAKELALKEGLSVGISSGAALFAAKQLAQKAENKGKNIVVIFPDSGIKYLSTPLFS